MPSYTRLYLLFAGLYIFACLCFAALDYFFRIEPPTASGVIAAMLGAIGPQQLFIRQTKRLMTSGEKARFAFGATLISLLIGGVIVAGLIFSNIEIEELMKALELGPGILSIAIAIASVLTWLAIYIGLGIGAKNTLKQAIEQNH